MARRLGFNDAKTKMLLGQWTENLAELERKLLDRLDEELERTATEQGHGCRGLSEQEASRTVRPMTSDEQAPAPVHGTAPSGDGFPFRFSNELRSERKAWFLYCSRRSQVRKTVKIVLFAYTHDSGCSKDGGRMVRPNRNRGLDGERGRAEHEAQSMRGDQFLGAICIRLTWEESISVRVRYYALVALPRPHSIPSDWKLQL